MKNEIKLEMTYKKIDSWQDLIYLVDSFCLEIEFLTLWERDYTEEKMNQSHLLLITIT